MADGIIITRDYNGDEKQRSLEGLVVTDGATYATAAAAWAALTLAQAALSVGTQAESHVDNTVATTTGTPATPLAQSNHEFIVYYHQTSDPTITRTYRISCADLSDPTFFQGTTEILDPANADVAAFIAAFEAWARINTNLTTVDQIVYEDD